MTSPPGPLSDGQWRLLYPGADYTFGTPDLPVFNHGTPEIGSPDVRSSDGDRPRGDGRVFGVDYLGGQTVSFDLGVRANSDAEVREITAGLRKLWRADAVRLTPGAVAELRTRYAGRDRVVFGRPRRFAPDYSDASVNRLVSVLTDFACVDDLFYAADDESVDFGIAPALFGGLMAPLAAPLSTTTSSDRSQGISVSSEMPVHPVVTVHGPITNPVVIIGDAIRWDIRIDLAYDETLVIDTRPWAQTALRNGAGNVSGRVRGTRMTKALLPPGRHEVSLQGTDPTGTARIHLAWRSAYSAL